MFICDDGVVDANMLWPWWIYVLEPNIVWSNNFVDVWWYYDRQVDVLDDDDWSGSPFKGRNSS